jgi:hypothetical protein
VHNLSPGSVAFGEPFGVHRERGAVLCKFIEILTFVLSTGFE